LNVSAKTKHATLKVQGSGSKKKQKMPVKTHIAGVLMAMKEDGQETVSGMVTADEQDTMEEDNIEVVGLTKSDPKPLMSTQEEAYQEQ
jgi:hypothetical protein